MLAYYEQQLVLLAIVCITAFLIDRQLGKLQVDASPGTGKLAGKYLVAYALAMTSDWLQGPYLYSLFAEEYGFPDSTVAFLFFTGFLSAALVAPLVGVWADQYGRRRLCLTFCLTYTLACTCITFPNLPILLLGRVLGGSSTAILFSAFESWLISSASSSSLTSHDLSTILGRATLVNGFMATTAGVASNHLVSNFRTFQAPFMASAGLLILTFVVIKATWDENYGTDEAGANVFQLDRLGEAFTIIRKDPRLLTLGLTQTCFEGSMYLFVFLWVPALQDSSHSPKLPLGLIFSCFMLSMMLGSLLYTTITSSTSASLAVHARLSSTVCALGAIALGASVVYADERQRFWAFCLFELCVGMYYPVQGMLRGTLIPNEHRATLSSLFRIPLNLFVIASLLTGASEARREVMVASSGALVFAAVTMTTVFVSRQS